jgi:hypothetical protein
MSADPEPERRRRRLTRPDEVWGDEPEEVDASRVVEELETQPELARRWYDHPTLVPFKVVGRFIRRSGKRVAVTIAGFAVILAGAAMLILPGPGILVIIAGLALLATEYVWAQRLLKVARARATQAKDLVFKKKDETPRQPEDDPTS